MKSIVVLLGLLLLWAHQVRAEEETYLVVLKGKGAVEYEGDEEGYHATKPVKGGKLNVRSEDAVRYTAHLRMLQEQVQQDTGIIEVLYSYTVAGNGFAAVLNDKQVALLREHSAVAQVIPNEEFEPLSSETHQTLGLSAQGAAWMQGYAGEGVVVGVIDSGITPQHPSFADIPTLQGPWDADLKPFPPPPASFEGSECAFGNTSHNPNDEPFTCNNKLVKANYFIKGALSKLRRSNSISKDEFWSARDTNGHGTHCAGIAVGNYGVEGSVNDTVKMVPGTAPRAHLAVYKACWQYTRGSTCSSVDLAAALEEAVSDGVDVINWSLGCLGTSRSCNTGFSTTFGFLAAVEGNVWTAVAAGNSGPKDGTLNWPAAAPWVTAVASSSQDDIYYSKFYVHEPVLLAGEYWMMEGTANTTLMEAAGPEGLTGEVMRANPLSACSPLRNAEDLVGKIAMIARGFCDTEDKWRRVQEAGAVGVLVRESSGKELTSQERRIDTIPGGVVEYSIGKSLYDAIRYDGLKVNVTLGSQRVRSLAATLSGFSSRGPNQGAMDIIQPDITAPGTQILAAGLMTAEHRLLKHRSGTSMASPAIAGLFAVLKQAHPDWSAAAGRSALVTTAKQVLAKADGSDVTPFEVGGGLANPTSALSPGLVYDITHTDYVAFTCNNNDPFVNETKCQTLISQGYSTKGIDLNMPSIGVSELLIGDTVVVKRKVTSVHHKTALYVAHVTAPPGVRVVVKPRTFRISPGETRSFTVTFMAEEGASPFMWSFGALEWLGRCTRKRVRSPIAVRTVPRDTPAPPTPVPLEAAPADSS